MPYCALLYRTVPHTNSRKLRCESIAVGRILCDPATRSVAKAPGIGISRYGTVLTRYQPFLNRYGWFLTRYEPFLNWYGRFLTRYGEVPSGPEDSSPGTSSFSSGTRAFRFCLQEACERAGSDRGGLRGVRGTLPGSTEPR